jgi:hypothetical protein
VAFDLRLWADPMSLRASQHASTRRRRRAWHNALSGLARRSAKPGRPPREPRRTTLAAPLADSFDALAH